MTRWLGKSRRERACRGCARGEHPLDPCAGYITLALPGVDLGDKRPALADRTIEPLNAQHGDLAFNHVEAAGVFGRAAKFAALRQAVRLPVLRHNYESIAAQVM